MISVGKDIAHAIFTILPDAGCNWHDADCFSANYFAQTQQPAPRHVHYIEPAQQSKSPTRRARTAASETRNHVFPVSTKKQQAQLFMNQGLNLSYAFNHAEAGRAYREAERLDPELAMAYWGEALALGRTSMRRWTQLMSRKRLRQFKKLSR